MMALAARRTFRLAGVLAVLIFLDHCIAAPLLLPATSTRLARVTRSFLEEPLAELASQRDIEGKTVFFLNPPSAFMGILIPHLRAKLDEDLPAHTHVLSSGLHNFIDVTRIDAYTLEITPQDGFASAEVDRLFRGPHHPMRVGQRVVLDAMTIEVLSLTRDQRPLRARFAFSRPLEDPSYLFVRHQSVGLAPFDLPAVGQTVRLHWYIWPHW